MFGYTADELSAGLNIANMVIPADRARAGQAFREVLVSGDHSGGNEYTGIRKDGCTFPVFIHSIRTQYPAFWQTRLNSIRYFSIYCSMPD